MQMRGHDMSDIGRVDGAESSLKASHKQYGVRVYKAEKGHH